MKDNYEPCLKCGLKDYKYVPFYMARDLQYNTLFIGQAPGHIETLTKLPFTGPAGKMLWRLMRDAGIDKSKVNITNIAHCAPPEDRKPTPSEIDCCSEQLKEELQLFQPSLIVALGEPSMNALTGQSNITNRRGQLFPLLSKWNYRCDVLCMLHPSFVMRQRQWIDIATKDLRLVGDYFNKAIVITRDEWNPEFIFDPPSDQLAVMLEEMSKQTTAVDIETPGELDMLTANIIGIAFASNRDKAIGLNISSERDKGSETWEVIKHFLEDKDAKKCTQNGQFDTGILETNGIKVKGVTYDTLLAEHTLHSDLLFNLDFLRGKYTSIPTYKPNKKEMKDIVHWTNDKREEMNCWDVITTHEVMVKQMEEMNPGQLKVLQEIEVPLIDVCNYMERRGIKVNVNTLASMNMQLAPQAEEIEKKYFAPLGLNPNSPVQIMRHFGIKSSGEDELVAMIKRGHKDSELFQALLDYRAVAKSVSTYLVGVYKKLRSGDRIHAHPKIEGTATGRLSYQNPNLQNIPKELRVIYTADNSDKVLIEGDYSQLELRVIANVAQEPTMLKELGEGKNTHHIMGKEIHNKEWSELTDQQKLRVKSVVFGTTYGRTPRSIAIEFGVLISQAREWQYKCVKRYPGLLDYLVRQEKLFKETQKCSTPFGRVRYLQTVTQAFNTPIQSLGADVVLTTLIELFKKGFDLCVTVHDSVVIQADKQNVKDVANELKKIMERPITQLNDYQFPAKIQAGDDWYRLKEV